MAGPALHCHGAQRTPQRQPEGRLPHFYLTSLPPDAARFLATVRTYWCIENQLHWVLDVAFDEDNNRAIIRHVALNLIKQDTATKIGVKNRRRKAGWDDVYLAYLICGRCDCPGPYIV